MAEGSSVKLHGMWASPFVMGVKLALKIKGIDFEYIEEDLANKSEALLKHNPVHKKVPLLVHNGQPVAESLVILEYIDEAWTDPPHLLPKDPYLRSRHRFWSNYFQPRFDLIRAEGEARKDQMKELMEQLDVIEGAAKEIYPDGVPSFREVSPGFLDIVFYTLFGSFEVVEEFLGAKLLCPERNSMLLSWIMALREVPAVKEVTPPMPELLGLFQLLRQKSQQPKA